MTGPLLVVRALTKEFLGALALDGVDFDVVAGEVHCLVGQNGAGKTTLIKCISGLVQPTSGEVRFEGEPLPVGNPSASLARGIATIYQELDLVPGLSAAENVFLGHELHHTLLLDRRRMHHEAAALFVRLRSGGLDPATTVEDLSPAGQQIVSVARALSRNVRLLIMDEPSAILGGQEVEVLFDVVRRLTAEGVGVIYISHRLDEVARIGDRITVLKDGRTVASGIPATTPSEELIGLMVGRAITGRERRPTAAGDRVVLSVRHLTREPRVRDVSFDLHEGEVIGLAGLVGSGRTELLRAVYGADTPQTGEVILDGQALRRGRPREAIRAGLALAPEERKSEALWGGWSLTRNVTIADLARFTRGPLVDLAAERREARRHLQALHTEPDDPDRLADEMSGGNQQKVVFARWLLRSSKVLLLDEPTRGIDVGAKVDMLQVIADLAVAGLGILMVSSELAELVGFCDRILVLLDGRVVAELPGSEASEEQILRHAVRMAPAKEAS